MKQMFDTLLITKPENIHYFSGFSGEGILLIKNFNKKTKQKKVLITDLRYLLRARAETKKDFRISVTQKNFKEIFCKALKTLRVKKLGFEASHITVENLRSLKQKTRGIKVQFIPTKNLIEEKRTIKSPTEINKIKKSCALAARILRETVKNLKLGKSELEVSAEIQTLAAKFGAEKMAFSPIIAFGPNSACPHAKPGKRKLKKGNVILFDIGVKLDGYCSDISRTFFTTEPNKKQREAYEAVLKAQETVIQQAKAGIKTKDLSNIAIESLKNSNQEDLSKFFTHSLGHGVGLEIHEAPNLSQKSKETLESSNIVTVEPGVYLNNKFGIRIEDTIAIKKSGCEILTKFSKKLTILKL